MTGFVDIVFGLPTVLFTVPLAILCGYWLLVILGALDLELLDALFDGVDGLADGLDGVDGAMDGVDAAFDVDVDGDLEVPSGGGLTGVLLAMLGIGKVPLAVGLTLFFLCGWMASFGLVYVLVGAVWVALPGAVITVLAAVNGLVGGGLGTWLLSTPLAPLFHVEKGRSIRSLVGETACLTTGRVDAAFGQAEVSVGGDHLLVQVRCDAAGNGLGRGDEALVVSWDASREAFVVEPLTGRD